MPSATRPHRPARWFADAWLTGSIGSRCTLVALDQREIRAVPGSTTYRTPGTVSEVSATLVARMTRRVVCRANTRCCSCLLYTSDAADEEDSVDLGGRRIIKKKKKK